MKGAIEGRLAAEIGAGGAVTGVVYSGSVTQPVEACLYTYSGTG